MDIRLEDRIEIADLMSGIGGTTKTLATNTAHLARLLQDQPYPAS